MIDLATKKWSIILGMKEPYNYCAACAIDDKLHVIGGFNYNGRLSSVYEFNTIT